MTTAARFRAAYADHRAAEGRGAGGTAELLALPYLRTGPLARQWGVRARTYQYFLEAVVQPLERQRKAPLRVLDLGAGNGWLCYRLAGRGHRALALDWRADAVDGLGAGAVYAARLPALYTRAAASFDAIPAARVFDLVVFNAAIHYATSLERAIAEAVRVTRPGGRLTILDSPFYRDAADGEQMVRDKRATLTPDLLTIPMIEYLTPDRLARASAALGLGWRRHRVWYPLWYELRPLIARLKRRRTPSRFDVWEAATPEPA